MKKILNLFLFIFAITLFFSCNNESKDPTIKRTAEQINGAGATFPFPIYSKWISEYQKVNPEARINYQSIGSGGGIRQITEKTVDFGASDNPLSNEQFDEAKRRHNSNLLQFPTVIGSVVLTYNIPGIKQSINLTQKAVADIYLGKIKKWNDPEIVNANPGIDFPDSDIIVCYRSDGSGTTYVFSDFLGKVSQEWKDQTGVGQSLKFPVGQGAKGNEGVTGLVKQIENAIGYVEYVYAVQNNLSVANIQNADGEFVAPSIDALSKAAKYSVDEMPEDLGQSITNSSGDDSYPISSYTYIMLYEDQDDKFKGEILKGFLEWVVTDGISFARELGYAPLPDVVIEKVKERLNLLKYNGQPL